MKDWQFNVLFFVGVGGSILLLISEDLGLKLGDNPTAVTGIAAILTYVLTQKKLLNRRPNKPDDKDDESQEGGGNGPT